MLPELTITPPPENDYSKRLKAVENLVFDCWGAELQHKQTPKFFPTHFSEQGYTLYEIDDKYFQAIMDFFDPNLEIKFEDSDSSSQFHKTAMSEDFTKKYNSTHKCYAPPSQSAIESLQNYLETVREDIEHELSGAFKIVNVRSAAIVSQGQFGPTNWHFDGGPRFLRKLLIYPKPLNEENGAFEIYTRKGKRVTIHAKGAIGVLGDVSLLKHRGVPGTKTGFIRPMLEITFAPAEKTDLTLHFAGQAAREIRLPIEELPEHLKVFYRNLIDRVTNENFAKNVPGFEEELKKIASQNDTFFKKIRHPGLRLRIKIFLIKLNYRYGFMGESDWKKMSNRCKNLNLGGGFRFNFDSWLNIDECNEKNIGSLVDMCTCKNLPVSSGTIQKVYSSHFLEHIDDQAVVNTLLEVKRVLAPDGKLVIKIPDFDRILKCYKSNDIRFFKNSYYGPALKTWHLKQQEDNIVTRTSFFFAGLWNKACGNPFSRNKASFEGAYHGPAPLSLEEHKEVLALDDPHEIAKSLVSEIRNTSDFEGFNHQNAWSKKQLKQVLESNGFKVKSQNRLYICLRFLSIPDIFSIYDMSQYLYATPNKDN